MGVRPCRGANGGYSARPVRARDGSRPTPTRTRHRSRGAVPGRWRRRRVSEHPLGRSSRPLPPPTPAPREAVPPNVRSREGPRPALAPGSVRAPVPAVGAIRLSARTHHALVRSVNLWMTWRISVTVSRTTRAVLRRPGAAAPGFGSAGRAVGEGFGGRPGEHEPAAARTTCRADRDRLRRSPSATRTDAGAWRESGLIPAEEPRATPVAAPLRGGAS